MALPGAGPPGHGLEAHGMPSPCDSVFFFGLWQASTTSPREFYSRELTISFFFEASVFNIDATYDRNNYSGFVTKIFESVNANAENNPFVSFDAKLFDDHEANIGTRKTLSLSLLQSTHEKDVLYIVTSVPFSLPTRGRGKVQSGGWVKRGIRDCISE